MDKKHIVIWSVVAAVLCIGLGVAFYMMHQKNAENEELLKLADVEERGERKNE